MRCEPRQRESLLFQITTILGSKEDVGMETLILDAEADIQNIPVLYFVIPTLQAEAPIITGAFF